MAFRALVSTSTASRSFSLLLASRRTFATSTARYVPLLRFRPLLALSDKFLPSTKASSGSGLRCFSTNRTASSLNDPSPNWSNRPPKETILLDGCDFEHWLVVVDPPDPNLTRDEIIKSYIQYLAKVVGSEEEARLKIYSVSTKHYFAFGALVSEELSYKLKELPGVRWVLPDSYLDVRNKDYGGEPFINGEAVPYDPKYHEEWVRNNARANDRNRRNDRPRNYDRSRNFERRRENMQNFQNRPPPPPPPPPMPGQDQAAQCAQNPMPPRDVPNLSTVPPMPNAMPRNAPNPGYQNQMPNYQGPPGNSPYPGPSNAHQGGLGGYQGPPNAFQGGPGGYPGAPNVPGGGPPGYQGISNAGPQGYPATPNSPQGGPGGYPGGPGGYQGGPGGYQGAANAYQGPGGYQGAPNAYQGPGNSYQGGGSVNPYPGTPNSPQGGRDGYQGGGNSFQGTPNSPQGGPGAYQAGGSSYPGRDMPGRDQ